MTTTANGNTVFDQAEQADRDTDQQLSIQADDRAPFSMMGDWIMLADIKPASKTLYGLLLMHVNNGRTDGKVWPSQGTLAAMMGYSRYDKIRPFMDELERIGAVRIGKTERYGKGFRERNHYFVRQNPPEGWQGPTSIADYYRQRQD